MGRSRVCCWRWSSRGRLGEVTKGFVGHVENFRPNSKGTERLLKGFNKGNSNHIYGLESLLQTGGGESR